MDRAYLLDLNTNPIQIIPLTFSIQDLPSSRASQDFRGAALATFSKLAIFWQFLQPRNLLCLLSHFLLCNAPGHAPLPGDHVGSIALEPFQWQKSFEQQPQEPSWPESK